MDTIAIAALAGFLGYLVYDEFSSKKGAHFPRKRLCDYYVSGSVFEDIPSSIQNGSRLIEVHVYADERGEPVVSKKPLQAGYDYAIDNVSFEQCCNDIANNAFPSTDPMILSIVAHTENVFTFNRMAEHLNTCATRRHIANNVEPSTDLDSLADKLVIVGSGNLRGTKLEEVVSMTTDSSLIRRLSYSQAMHPRDQPELVAYNRDHITIVAPDPSFGKTGVNADTPFAYGCQWNLFSSPWAPGGFIEKHVGLQ
jgi:hypothetical protein